MRRLRDAFLLVPVILLGCAEDPTRVEQALMIDSPDKVIGGLAHAYRTRDYDLFVRLLADDPNRNADFLFFLREPTEHGETQWGLATETRTHRRMFEPWNTSPGDQPVPKDLYLESVTITLTRNAEWTERKDLYSKDEGADGLLDPAEWRAWTTTYSADVFAAMAGELDYQVLGRSDFVVVEDLSKPGTGGGRFSLLIWEDLGSGFSKSTASIESQTWGSLKSLYR